MKHQPRIFVYPDRCLGCHSCELACALAHSKTKSLAAAIYEKPKPQRRLFVETGHEFRAPIHCRQCEDPPCVRACPSGALFVDRSTLLVHYREQRCISCFMCAMACPFGVIRSDTENRFIVKCDYCPELDTPACVTACPSRALRFETEAEYERGRLQLVSRLYWDQ